MTKPKAAPLLPFADPFEGFRPETPTEQALWNHIRKLKGQLYVLGLTPHLELYQQPVEVVAPANARTISLAPTARLIANVTEFGSVRVLVEAYVQGKENIQLQYMEARHPTYNKFVAADLMLELHKRASQQIAALILGDNE